MTHNTAYTQRVQRMLREFGASPSAPPGCPGWTAPVTVSSGFGRAPLDWVMAYPTWSATLLLGLIATTVWANLAWATPRAEFVELRWSEWGPWQAQAATANSDPSLPSAQAVFAAEAVFADFSGVSLPAQVPSPTF